MASNLRRCRPEPVTLAPPNHRILQEATRRRRPQVDHLGQDPGTRKRIRKQRVTLKNEMAAVKIHRFTPALDSAHRLRMVLRTEGGPEVEGGAGI